MVSYHVTWHSNESKRFLHKNMDHMSYGWRVSAKRKERVEYMCAIESVGKRLLALTWRVCDRAFSAYFVRCMYMFVCARARVNKPVQLLSRTIRRKPTSERVR